MPQANIDMDLIREAIARRAQGGSTPATEQMTTPGGTIPGGGANTPTTSPAIPNMQGGAQMPSVNPAEVSPALKATKEADTPMYDQETRDLTKALMTRLLKYI